MKDTANEVTAEFREVPYDYEKFEEMLKDKSDEELIRIFCQIMRRLVRCTSVQDGGRMVDRPPSPSN
jgi:hypothetical protein